MKDEIFRLDGVGDIPPRRATSMRAWDPQKMTSRNITVNEVIQAVQNQNMQVAAGQISRSRCRKGSNFS